MRVLLAILTFCAIVQAGESSVSPEAKRHVDSGVEAYNAARYEEAVKEFELAYRLSNRPALLFNIARAEAKLGHEEAAIAFLRRYLEERPNAPDAPAVLAEIEAHEKTLEAARAKVAAEKDAARAAELARKSEAEAKDAERRAAEATAQARRELEKQQRQLELQKPMPPPDPHATVRRAGIGMTVAGVLVLVTGVALGVVASVASDSVSGSKGDFKSCCLDDQNRGQLTGPLGISFDVIGGAAAAVGIGLLSWSARK
jgi:tetratricopeptide (TPR) repeat protein